MSRGFFLRRSKRPIFTTEARRTWREILSVKFAFSVSLWQFFCYEYFFWATGLF